MPNTERWIARAIEYRRALEDQHHLLITTPTTIRRKVIIRYKEPWNRSGVGQFECYAGKIRDHFNDRRRANFTDLVKVWVVEGPNETNSNASPTEHSRWNNLAMAQAHRDGRMYHYAKHLMTKEG